MWRAFAADDLMQKMERSETNSDRLYDHREIGARLLSLQKELVSQFVFLFNPFSKILNSIL